MIADFGLLRDYKSSVDDKTRNANHIFLDFKGDLENPNYLNSTFEAQIERVNNDTYLKVFDSVLLKTPVMPGSQSTMNSNLKFNLDQEYQNFSTGFEIHESLGTKSSDRYQFTLPYYNLSKNLINVIDDYSIGVSLDFYSSGNNSLTNTNNL